MEESLVDETRTLKQNYLIENIIQTGYDAEAFSQYMAEKKPNGTDIEVWTYEELIGVVDDFITSLNNDTEIYYEEEQLRYDSMDGPSENIPEGDQMFEPRDNDKHAEMNKKTIVGGDVKTTVKITKEEKEKTGMFSTTVFYTIETLPQG